MDEMKTTDKVGTVVVVGAPLTGKTSLIYALTGSEGVTETTRSIGGSGEGEAKVRLLMDECATTDALEGKLPEHAAAQIVKSFCTLITFDVTRRDTFAAATRRLLPAVKELAPHAFLVMVGCKADSLSREVTPDVQPRRR